MLGRIPEVHGHHTAAARDRSHAHAVHRRSRVNRRCRAPGKGQRLTEHLGKIGSIRQAGEEVSAVGIRSGGTDIAITRRVEHAVSIGITIQLHHDIGQAGIRRRPVIRARDAPVAKHEIAYLADIVTAKINAGALLTQHGYADILCRRGGRRQGSLKGRRNIRVVDIVTHEVTACSTNEKLVTAVAFRYRPLFAFALIPQAVTVRVRPIKHAVPISVNPNGDAAQALFRCAGILRFENGIMVDIPENRAHDDGALLVTKVRVYISLVRIQIHLNLGGRCRHKVRNTRGTAFRADTLLVHLHEIRAGRKIVKKIAAVGGGGSAADLHVNIAVKDAITIGVFVKHCIRAGYAVLTQRGFIQPVAIVVVPHQVTDGTRIVVGKVHIQLVLKGAERYRFRIRLRRRRRNQGQSRGELGIRLVHLNQIGILGQPREQVLALGVRHVRRDPDIRGIQNADGPPVKVQIDADILKHGFPRIKNAVFIAVYPDLVANGAVHGRAQRRAQAKVGVCILRNIRCERGQVADGGRRHVSRRRGGLVITHRVSARNHAVNGVQPAGIGILPAFSFPGIPYPVTVGVGPIEHSVIVFIHINADIRNALLGHHRGARLQHAVQDRVALEHAIIAVITVGHTVAVQIKITVDDGDGANHTVVIAVDDAAFTAVVLNVNPAPDNCVARIEITVAVEIRPDEVADETLERGNSVVRGGYGQVVAVARNAFEIGFCARRSGLDRIEARIPRKARLGRGGIDNPVGVFHACGGTIGTDGVERPVAREGQTLHIIYVRIVGRALDTPDVRHRAGSRVNNNQVVLHAGNAGGGVGNPVQHTRIRIEGDIINIIQRRRHQVRPNRDIVFARPECIFHMQPRQRIDYKQ